MIAGGWFARNRAHSRRLPDSRSPSRRYRTLVPIAALSRMVIGWRANDLHSLCIQVLTGLINNAPGFFHTMQLAFSSYLSDCTPHEQKTIRFVLADFVNICGRPIGLVASAQLLKHYGYPSVFITAAAISALAVFYAIVRLRNDTHKKDEQEERLVSDQNGEANHESSHQDEDSPRGNIVFRYLKAGG